MANPGYRLRDTAKSLAYRSGTVTALHRWRNRATLTAVMFHRVVAEAEVSRSCPDPAYTVTDRMFAACLGFFRRHYTLVSLDDVLAAREGRRRLPPRALLVTLDDGWEDNAMIAVPLLRRAGVPAVVFVASDAVIDPSPRWWQEVLLCAWRSGRARYETLWMMASADNETPPPDNRLHRLLLRYGAIDPAARTRLLSPYAGPAPRERDIMSPQSLHRLAASGVAVGSHGAAHLPLPMLANTEADLARARQSLAALLPGCTEGLAAVSFPHGRYDAATVAACRRLGHRLMFTSESCLNETSAGVLDSDLLGRVEMAADQIGGANGQLDPARLAAWLFTQRHRRLSADHAPAAP